MDINVYLAKLSEEVATAIRCEIGRSISADTAEIYSREGITGDPYYDGRVAFDPDYVVRLWFARAPRTETWIWFNHLDRATVHMLRDESIGNDYCHSLDSAPDPDISNE